MTDDESIEIGDIVLVPVYGEDCDAVDGQVVDVEYFSAEDAPQPPEKTEYIVRRLTDEELGFDE